MNYPYAFGDYVLLEHLGQGGMSHVDLARKVVEDAAFVRFLVIKRIRADKSDQGSYLRMFKDEARTHAELKHQNIAAVYDFGRLGDEFFLALEYVPGMDVREMITTLRDRGQRVPLAISLRILCDVLSGLEYAHAKVDMLGRPMNIVHRDVNPRNIMLGIDGEVKLIDFGVAKATMRMEQTQTDHVKGKFAYMSPEQVQGHAIDHRADLYALALTMHELLTGFNPFRGLNHIQIAHRLISGRIAGELPPVRELADQAPLRAVHRNALAQQLQDRYPDARAFRLGLEELSQHGVSIASHLQLKQFLLQVDPHLEDRLRAKMSGYAGAQDLSLASQRAPSAAVMPPAAAAPTMVGDPTSATLDRPALHTTNTSMTATRTGLLAGGLFLAGAGWAVVAVLLAVGLIALLLWSPWQAPAESEQPLARATPARHAEGPVEAPTPDAKRRPGQQGAGSSGPAGVTGSTPSGAGSKAPGTARTPGVDGSSSQRPSSTSPEAAGTQAGTPSPWEPSSAPPAAPPDPSPALASPTFEPAPVELIPAPVAAPTPVAPPEPVTAPAPPPPLAHGTLQVTSPEKGRAIYIDGKPTGKTTPARISWPVGVHTITVEGYATSKKVTLREKAFSSARFP